MKLEKKKNNKLTLRQRNNLLQATEESLWLANFTSKATKETYSNAVREFLGFHGMQSLDDLRSSSAAHVISWRDKLIEEGRSARTVNNRVSALSSLFNHLCERQIINKNPTHGLKRPKVQQTRVETPVITKEEVRKLLDAPGLSTFKGLRDTAILYTLFYTGCRRSEVCRLKVADLMVDNGYFVMDFMIKGGKKNRVAIHQELQAMLQRYLSEATHTQDPKTPLFTAIKQEKLKPLSPQAINQLFKKYTNQINLPGNITPHSARATFITQALENNCPIEAVQASVCHSDISTTQMYDKREKVYRDSASFAVRF